MALCHFYTACVHFILFFLLGSEPFCYGALKGMSSVEKLDIIEHSLPSAAGSQDRLLSTVVSVLSLCLLGKSAHCGHYGED